MKIVLLFPPAGSLVQPYTSLPALTAYLRRAGHTVVQRDLAIEAVEDLINPLRLRQAMNKVSTRLAQLAPRHELTEREMRECAKLERVSIFAEYIVEHIDDAKRILRDPSLVPGYHLPAMRKQNLWALQVVERGMELLSAEYWPSSWSRDNFVMPDYGYDLPSFLAAATDRDKNIFFDYYDQKVVPSILEEEPDIVGISCTYLCQVQATLTLLSLLKKARPQVHVCLGGAVITHLAPILEKEPKIFSHADTMVVGEGEPALLGLTEALAGRRDLSQVPNLIYFDQNEICRTVPAVEDINALPAPDYAGLPLDRYLVPEVNILLPTDRGCYWHRCAFCVISLGMRHRYRPRKIPLVIEDMKTLHRQFGVRCFFLSNDAIPPKRMKALAQAIKDENLDFHWQTETRLEKELTLETARLLAEGGCRRLMVGIESGSQRILDLMDKGTQIADLPRLLWNCHEAGIAMHTFLMLGCPTETREEARQTLAFVEDNCQAIMSLTYQVFAIYPDSKIYAYPDKYGVIDWEPLDPDCLNVMMSDFRVSSGMSQDEIMNEALPEAHRRFAHLFSSVPWTVNVISANKVPGFEDLDRSYLTWLAYRGIANYREVPTALEQSAAPPGDRDVANMLVEMGNGVHWRSAHGRFLVLFNPQTVQALCLPSEALTLLEQCDGRHTVRQLANGFAAGRQGLDYVRRYYQALKLCKRLVEAEFMATPQSEQVPA